MTFTARIALDVDATRTRQGIVSVKSRMTFPARDNLTLRVAKWLPAYHAPRGPLKFMAGYEFHAEGGRLRWLRDPSDVFRLIVAVEGSVTGIECAHQFLSPTEPKQGPVLMGESMLRLQWAGLCLYPEGYDPSDIGIEASVLYPDGWHAASALKVERKHDGHVHYAPCGLAELIDSPVLAGAHHVHAELADGVDLEIFADETSQLPTTQEQIGCHANLVEEADAVFARRPFGKYTFLLGVSDQLGHLGLEHRASSETGVAGDYFSDWDHSMGKRSLLPHEYVHSWIGKYRVPFGNLTGGFNERMTNELLWVYEGLTQYYGHVLAARSGLISVEQTLGAIALIAATYDCRPGRRWRSLADTVHDPIIAERASLPWKSWQRSEDYYAEGLLLWLEVDMTIRKLTSNTRSLDDFARCFFTPSSATEMPSSYDRNDLIAGLHQIQTFDWEQFLAARVDDLLDQAPLDGLLTGGYRLAWSDQPSDWHRCAQNKNSHCDLSFSLGMKVGIANKVIEVTWDSPAFDAGLAVGTRLLSVDGADYAHDCLADAVARSLDSDRPISLTVKQHGVRRDVEIRWSGGHRFPVLTPLEGRHLLLEVLQSRGGVQHTHQ